MALRHLIDDQSTNQNLYHLAVCHRYSDASMVGDESYFHVVGLERGLLLKDHKTATLVPKARMERIAKEDPCMFALGKTRRLWQPLPELDRYVTIRDIGRIDPRRVACVLKTEDGITRYMLGIGTGQLHGGTWRDVDGMVCPSFALARIEGQNVVRVIEFYMEDLRNDDFRRQIAVRAFRSLVYPGFYLFCKIERIHRIRRRVSRPDGA